MNFESALKILGLTGNPSHDQIVEAYREKVRANHPDKFDMANEKVKKVAEEEMKQINAAFNFLKQNFFKDNSEINRQEVVPEEQKNSEKNNREEEDKVKFKNEKEKHDIFNNQKNLVAKKSTIFLIAISAVLVLFLIFYFLVNPKEKSGDKPADDKNKFAFDSSDIKITPVNETNSFNIRYNFQKGETYKYRVTTISANNQLISGDTTINNYMKQTLNYLVDLTVDKVETESVMEISCNIHSFKIDADLNGDTVYYESGVTKDSTIKKDIAQYEALLNNPFGVRLSNKGEILEIFRVDKIVTTLINKAGYGDSLTAENKVTIKESITSGLLKPLLMQLFRELPDAKVAKDSTWEFSQEKSQLLVFQIGYKTKYALKNIGMYDSEKLAEIDGSLETEITGDTKLTEGQINYEFQKPVTWANGKIYFNIEKGYVQKSRTNTKMELNYSMQMPGPKGIQKANRNETVTTTNIVELL